MRCGQQSSVLYEADNLECFPTVTAVTEIFGAGKSLYGVYCICSENGRMIEKEIGKFNKPFSLVRGPAFTVGNVRKIFVRCKSSSTDGCSESITLVLSYWALNKCENDDHESRD